jgi:prepilin peptidase CpaA
MIADPFHPALTVATICLLIAAALHDLAARTLPDGLSVALAACGLSFHFLRGDLLPALLVALTVFAVALLPWRAGALGGGDVKLLSASALAVALPSVPSLLIGTVLGGGILALVFLALHPFVPASPGRRPAGLLARILRVEAWRIRRRGPLPYAVAIAGGGIVSLLNR